MRVVPRLDTKLCARLQGLCPRDAEQGTAPRRIVRTHSSQRPWPRAPSEPEQHGLGLVVLGVAEQYEPFTVRQCFAQRVIPSSARSGFGTAFATDVHCVHLGHVNAETLRNCRRFGRDGC